MKTGITTQTINSKHTENRKRPAGSEMTGKPVPAGGTGSRRSDPKVPQNQLRLAAPYPDNRI